MWCQLCFVQSLLPKFGVHLGAGLGSEMSTPFSAKTSANETSSDLMYPAGILFIDLQIIFGCLTAAAGKHCPCGKNSCVMSFITCHRSSGHLGWKLCGPAHLPPECGASCVLCSHCCRNSVCIWAPVWGPKWAHLFLPKLRQMKPALTWCIQLAFFSLIFRSSSAA